MQRLFILVLILVTFIASKPNYRLIQTSPTEISWMPEEAVQKLIEKGVKFMDKTYTPLLEVGSVPTPKPLPKNPSQQSTVIPIISQADLNRFTKHIKDLSSFYNRYYNSKNGVDAAEYIYKQFYEVLQSLPVERRSLFSLKYFNHTKWMQPSIIVAMKGRTLGDEFVVFGAHEDSIAGSSTSKAPELGADDNASGAAAVLESFRLIAESKFVPDRSIEWHIYAAEEVGLLGSQEIVQDLKKRNINVHAAFVEDMIGYGDPNNPNFGIITDYTHKELTDFTKLLMKEYIKSYGMEETKCGYGCSDHASFHAAGYRVARPYETYDKTKYNKKIHTSGDVIDILDLKRALEFVKLATSFIIELSVDYKI